MHAQRDEEGLHRNVGVPDHDILREQRVKPEHREREHHQAEVAHHAALGEDVARPSTRRRQTAVSAIVTIALQNAPAKNHQPNSVECHSGDSDITRSNESSEYTTPKQMHTAGASRRILGGGIRISAEVSAHRRASSPRETPRNVMLSRSSPRAPSRRGEEERHVEPGRLWRDRMPNPGEDQFAAEKQEPEQDEAGNQESR